MAVVIRMQVTGKLKQHAYRIVVQDLRTRRQGKVIELLGHYDPRSKDLTKQVSVSKDRAMYWLTVGAQPSDTVWSIFKQEGIQFVRKSARKARMHKASKAHRKAAMAKAKAGGKPAKAAQAKQ